MNTVDNFEKGSTTSRLMQDAGSARKAEAPGSNQSRTPSPLTREARGQLTVTLRHWEPGQEVGLFNRWAGWSDKGKRWGRPRRKGI